MEITRRLHHHDPYQGGTWRESFYQVSHGPRSDFSRRPFKDKPAPLPPTMKDAKDKKLRRKSEDGYMKASERAYKAFNQHEKSRKVHNEVSEKRKVFRKSYDTTGPNDERYYVSASSGIGTDGSKTETDSSGKEEEGNIFVKLLQNQVLNYNNHKIPSPRSRVAKQPQSLTIKEDTRHVSPPPSPTPDYGVGGRLAGRRHMSKSISSLVVDTNDVDIKIDNLTKKMSESSLELRSSPAIPLPDYEGDHENDQRLLTHHPRETRDLHQSRDCHNERDVWSNVERYKGESKRKDSKSDTRHKQLTEAEIQRRGKNYVAPTETLKEVIKHRPPVAEVVREITKESEKDKLRQREREQMQREAEREFQNIAERDLKNISGEFRNEKEGKDRTKATEDEDEAQKIYREIIDVVSSNSPASLQYARGRMVGYGEEAQTTLRRGDRRNAALVTDRQTEKSKQRVARMRLSEDRASVTTSIDSYPFSPSSPWSQALPSRYNRYGYPVFPQKTFGLPSPTGPVSFAGFSSPSSQLTTSSFAPASLVQIQPPGRGKMKRKKKWFNIF